MSVSRPVRAALWLLLLSGSASTGAFVAAHSNPLPPQVHDGVPTSVVPRSPNPKPERWTGTIRSISYHQLYVGGRCSSNWRTTLSFVVRADGKVSGSGRARLVSKGAPCPFAVAQSQIGAFELKVSGELAGVTFRLRFTEVGYKPPSGAEDLGGFRTTLLGPGERSVLSVPVRGSSAAKTISLRVAGADRDTFVSTNQIRLACKGC